MDVLKAQDIVLDAIYEWVKEDAPLNVKMTLTPDHCKALADKVISAFTDLVRNN